MSPRLEQPPAYLFIKYLASQLPAYWFTKYLASQERLYYSIRPHSIDQMWFVARWTALAIGVGVGISLAGALSIGVAVAATMFVAILGAGLLRSMVSTVLVTGQRIIVVKGVVRQVAKHVALSAVHELRVDYPRCSRRLGVGDIVVYLHGQRRPGFRVSHIQEPDGVYQYIRDICFGEMGEKDWSELRS